MDDKNRLTLAEKEAINQIRRWPTLYSSAHSFFLNSIVGTQGSYQWRNGLLVSQHKKPIRVKGENRYVPYPFKVPFEFARSVLNRNTSGFPSVYTSTASAINNIPDNAHKDWLDFISFHLFLDSKITPELYEILLNARSIRDYGTVTNPYDSSSVHFRNEWAKYFHQIPSYQSRVRVIEETLELGKIPSYTYMGMDI